ncbi:dynein axonemal assembly factor 19 [Megachile rotundata]|uniref:dynein axonemal assembly factor 19 n=1 Tax=Megachile rotundata TaxID=143995 RepID=UPI000614E0C0|nr:PREDICTED: coiled-coil domain-containing protein 103 [Megachile rotundata]
MSKLRSKINYKSLELELQEALKADELYKLQNEAKLRAVEQNVPRYEDFRQMVLAAHLKPLEHTDVQPTTNGSWNPIANKDNSNTMLTFDKQNRERFKDDLKLSKDNNIFETQVPTTYEQFVRAWQAIETYEEKFNYLQNIRHNLRDKIFWIEIPSTLLVDIINVCLQSVSSRDNVLTIINILSTLSKCNRFSLAISFMRQNEKETCMKLFYKMLDSVKEDKVLEDTVKTIGLIYGVTFE